MEFTKTLDKKVAQKVGMRLRTLLKLPKAHKWVCYEWFYANIDQPLFFGKNDFQICLKENFPHLKTLMLRRVEWCKIRRLMGKPRRCSQAFFNEERAALNMKRNKIRQLQQQKVVDISQYRDLPENIPLSLVIGTKVTSLLRKPQDGLFTGTIDAVDTANGTYRITFDRSGIGTHSVPDYEVLSTDPPEFIPLSSFQTKVRPRLPLIPSPRFLELLGNQVAQALGDSDPLQSVASPCKTEPGTVSSNLQDEGTLGGFPIKFLALLVRLSKILAVKKKMIYELKQMNTEAEKLLGLQEPISYEFQKQYASIILELDKLNTDLNDYLKAIQQYSAEIAPDQGLTPIAQPDFVRQKFFAEAKEIVERSLGNSAVKCEKVIDLISQLLSLMLHLRSFADADISSYELKSLFDALQETQKMINSSNVQKFENAVKVPINHIESSLSHLGNLGAFAESLMDGV
ncbi:protein lin-9-like protein [Leptotrombidium deliense]|uniref:Protein lin-9-like protein n=1 Tax=Leptotrombidium deliense TaxID=299467 RepID=A0A443STQ2_9ACAR|nr:protein lin-9-like protein [Leptotrombidium deliense]